MNRSLTRCLLLPLLLAACAPDLDDLAAGQAAAPDEVARLTEAMRDLPGELVITRAGERVDDQARARLLAAGKVIHVYSDQTVGAYVNFVPAGLPEGLKDIHRFRELRGDTVIAPSEELPAYIAQEEAKRGGGVTSQAVGLQIGHGALWQQGTVAFEIDASFTGAELDTLRRSIGSWNAAVDALGERNRVRFVPRYWADGRPYVRFVRVNSTAFCGRSQVGRHDNIFTNWWSHNLEIACVDEHTLHHEMGHTAGLFHEQQRCDRDLFVSVTVADGTNCDRQCGGGAMDYGPYNYLSVMHYPYNRGDACGIFQISPSSGNFRGTPASASSAARLDINDVLALNQMYRGQPALPRIGAGTFYNLVPQSATGSTLAVPASSLVDGKQLVQFTRLAGVRDQQWELVPDALGFFDIRNRNSGKCMEVLSFSTVNGGAVGQWTCWGGDNQKWIVAPSSNAPGTVDLINKLSGKSVDVPSTANGVPIQQWDHHGGTNQRFAMSQAF